MNEVRLHVAGVLGHPHEQTDRRLRDLRTHFAVIAEQLPGQANRYRYSLAGWHPSADSRHARRSIPARVEAAVYLTWGNRCAMCGRTPRDDGVRLVIDHVIPLEWGGTNYETNLQPLCTEHNHAKQAHFSSFDQYADAIRAAIALPEVHLRIGELLKALEGQPVPVDLINVIAREENRGDPTRRMRDLRALGWQIEASRRKKGARTRSFYTLKAAQPWPTDGPAAAVAKLEADRRAKKFSN
jgi:hypothetical protein